MVNFSLPEKLTAFYFDLFKPILPFGFVSDKVTELTDDLSELLALALESGVSYHNNIYHVDISQCLPIGAEPPSCRIFRFRFLIHRDLIHIKMLILPPYLRGQGFGRDVWEHFLYVWQQEFSCYEAECKTQSAFMFWQRMGFKVNYGTNINDLTGKYLCKKLYYKAEYHKKASFH